MEALLDAVGLSASALSVICAAIFLGAVVQGSIGFGLNLIAVPAIAIYRPEVLPASAIIFALPMTLGSAFRERAHIEWGAVVSTTIGRLPGVVLGAAIVRMLSPESLALLIGAFVVIAVAMSVVRLPVARTRRTEALAGFLGGVMGTASSIGGPPLALLFQHEPGPAIRSTLGAAFLVGTVLSLSGLAAAGEVEAMHFRFGLAMVPAVLFGLLASRWLHGWLDSGWLRPCVLGFSALAGIGVLIRGLLSF